MRNRSARWLCSSLTSASISDDGAATGPSAYASANLFSRRGSRGPRSRFGGGEEQPGETAGRAEPRLWRQRFGADPSIMGRDILIDSEARKGWRNAAHVQFPRPGHSSDSLCFDRGNAAALGVAGNGVKS